MFKILGITKLSLTTFAGAILFSNLVLGSTVSVPCEMANDLCLVRGGFNNLQNLWLALDTGSSFSIIDTTYVPSLNATSNGTAIVDGAGKGATNDAVIYESVAIQIGPLILPSEKILALPIQYAAKGVHHQVDGFLGWNVFNNFIVNIDYPNAKASFATFDSVLDWPNDAISFEFGNDNVPVVVAKIKLKDGKIIEGKFLVDIGQLGSDIIINEPFRLAHPELLKEFPIDHVSVDAVGGKINFDRSRVTELQMNSIKISPATVAYPISPNGVYARADIAGAIGVSVFKRYSCTFDYSRKKILLEAPTQKP
ncbi:MAG TPA: aspartyl protease family protein [Bdellovibrio sp.]|nr:aspartyl protease family protein [Bdellovibrio sp.]